MQTDVATWWLSRGKGRGREGRGERERERAGREGENAGGSKLTPSNPQAPPPPLPASSPPATWGGLSVLAGPQNCGSWEAYPALLGGSEKGIG